MMRALEHAGIALGGRAFIFPLQHLCRAHPENVHISCFSEKTVPIGAAFLIVASAAEGRVGRIHDATMRNVLPTFGAGHPPPAVLIGLL